MSLLFIAKAALYGIFLNYYCYYVLNGTFIPYGTVLFFLLACLCVGIEVLLRRRLYIGTEIKCWLLYAVIAFVSTMIILAGSGDTGYVGAIVKYVQRVVIVMMIAYICEREGSIRFGLRLMAVTAAACAVSILLVTNDIQLKLDVSSGADLSANDVGSIMAFGCFALLFAWGKRRKSAPILSVLKIAAMICCVIVIFLTGSRKSILAVVLMAVLLALLCGKDYYKSLNFSKILVVIVIGIAAYLFVSTYLLPLAEQTNLYTRLFGRGVEDATESDAGRLNLYGKALTEFINHPFFGIGFKQFEELHGVYSHSTYVEPLACSGLVGLLYLYPYYTMLKKQIQLIRQSPKNTYARLKQKEIFVYLCMFLFVAVGIPYLYKDIPCILLGTFIASQAIGFTELNRDGAPSADY